MTEAKQGPGGVAAGGSRNAPGPRTIVHPPGRPGGSVVGVVRSGLVTAVVGSRHAGRLDLGCLRTAGKFLEHQWLVAVPDPQLAAGKSKIVDMVPAMYVGVDARLYPAAGRSVLAHMIQLVKTGRVATSGAAGPDSEYRLS